jgi:eukaryotic-like serine/threonine-protein kinase
VFRRRRRLTEDETAPQPAGRNVEEEVVNPPPRRPVLWPWLLLLLVLVAGAVIAALLLTRDDGGSATRVPDVVGLSTASATRELGQRGYPAIVQTRVSNGTQPGAVLSQKPVAGTELDRGGQVTIVVAGGPRTVGVPNVVGLSAADALLRLQAVKLSGRTTKIVSRQPAGRVIRQSPEGGAQVEKRSTVVLTVSKRAALATVPDVTGATEASATATLTRLGFRLSVSRIAATQPKGIVVSQSPAGGTRAPKRSVVGLNVSTGPTTTGPATRLVVVPDVVGAGQAEAVRKLEASGLIADSASVASSRPRGTVVAQKPAAERRVAPSSTVRLSVSLGSGPRPVRVVPDVTGRSESQAKRALIGAGFTVRTIDRPVTDPGQQAIVVKQSPSPGSRARAGTQVLIYVGRLPSPAG